MADVRMGTRHRQAETTRAASVRAPRPSGLERLQPVDSAPFRQPSHTGFIWFTIGLVWLLSLLPWRSWEFAPNLLLLVITFWAMNEPRRVGLFTAFLFGILMDVHDGTRLGAQTLSFLIAVYGALLLARRIRQFSTVVQAVHLLPMFLLAEAVSHLARAWFFAGWAGWDWAWSVLLTAALWPLADVLLHMPQRPLDDASPGAI